MFYLCLFLQEAEAVRIGDCRLNFFEFIISTGKYVKYVKYVDVSRLMHSGGHELNF
jgi:hypothetical protein